jgi:hypothetical protein
VDWARVRECAPSRCRFLAVSDDWQAERFKWAMLNVAVVDPPWNTGLAWVDASDAFPERSPDEIDRLVRESLIQLLDAGYIWFFRRTSFDDEFAVRPEAEALPRGEVLAVLAEGRLPADATGASSTASVRGSKVALRDVLSFRATEAGRRHFATLSKSEYLLFGAGEAN